MELPNRALHSLYVIAVNRAKADEEERLKAEHEGKPPPMPSNVDIDDLHEAFLGR